MESVCGKQKAVRAETPFLPDQNGRKQAKALPKSCVCLVNIQELDNKQAGSLTQDSWGPTAEFFHQQVQDQ